MRQPDGSFLADARAPLEDVVATVGPEFDIGDIGDEVDTLGGYVMTRVGPPTHPRPGRAGTGQISRSRCSIPIRAG